ncbi:MAG: hypothetical protein KGJ21_02195 [Pseudomonadota bacterium]|nr:hypothetical protein [Pseudomonadota bacterium]
MTSKWTTSSLPGEAGDKDATIPLAKQFAVVLLRGKNAFGDMIYSYVKIFTPNIRAFKDAMEAGKGFNPSDFGEVLAAGKGEPPPEVHAEMTSLYPFMDSKGNPRPSAAPIPTEKKSWDEY